MARFCDVRWISGPLGCGCMLEAKRATEIQTLKQTMAWCVACVPACVPVCLCRPSVGDTKQTQGILAMWEDMG